MIFLTRGIPAAVFLLLFIVTPIVLNAQERNISYGIETSVYASADDLPFWFYANSDGVVDPASNNLISRFYSYYTSETANSIRVQTGFDVYSRFSEQNALFFNELYGSIGYGFLNLNAGRFYDPVGLNDDDLSMGSMEVSRNATPIPKIQLETNGFTNVPFTQGYLQFDTMLSHGWFEEDRVVTNAYLHQKYFYLKVNYKMLEGIGGIIHNVMWGGTHPRYNKLPSSFSDYLRVLTGFGAADEKETPGGEIDNSIGNAVAGYDFRLNVNLDKFQFKAYRLFYLEDKVSTRFRSPWDGMWGAGVEFNDPNSFLSEILWEHMNTKRQDSFDFEPRGTASYYRHFIYQSGWTYEGNILGNPLLLNRPVPNFGSHDNITNNIIVAHHIGIKGRPTERLFYKSFFTYSRNYGTVVDQGDDPPYEPPYIPLSELRMNEFSTLLNAEYLLIPEYGLSLTGGVAWDIGDLYGENRFGFQIGIRWDRVVE
jgi:hypothetical protein